MKQELDALRYTVDDATERVIAAECELAEAREVERHATAARVTSENARNVAVGRLNEARAALDARLGIRIVAQPLPVPRQVGPAQVIDGRHPAPLVEPEYEDDDEPVRG